MKELSPRTLPWKVLATALLALPLLTTAQVGLYQFSQSVGTYEPITASDGGVALGIPTYWPHVNNNRAWVNNPFNDPDGQVTFGGYFSPAEGPGYPIGFDFTFNGDVFDVIGISNGGWISFGKSSDGLNAVWVYNNSGSSNADPFVQSVGPGGTPGPTPNYRRNRVAGFGNSSLQQVDWTSLNPPGQLSTLRMATIGTAPNRVCVVQWGDYGLRNDVTVAMNKINFQIRLNEVDNSVEVVFGPQDWVSTLGRYVRSQCGLSGRAREDFNGRETVYEEPAFLYDWNTTVAADDYMDFCQFTKLEFGQPNGSGIPPQEGLTWRWVAPVCPPPAWPYTFADISFDSASATWDATDSGEWEYHLTDINDVNGPEVSAGTTTEPSISFFGLEPLTTYYLFVRSICNGEPGMWSMSSSFRTIGGGVIVCDGTATDVNYCSHPNSTVQWLYQSADGSPLKVEFSSGFISSNTADSFKIWNSYPPQGNPDLNLPQGNPAGLIHESATGVMVLQLITEMGSCETQPWFLPFEWRVGCKNCTDPLVSYAVVEDCDNQQYSVDVNVFSMGSATSLLLNNSLSVPPTTATTAGIHTVGPFPAGQAVQITAQNADNMMCHADSPPLMGQPCALVDCGPTYYTYCYGDNEERQWAYQGADDQEIGIRFLRGNMGWGDIARMYNGLDLDMVVPQELPGFFSLTNKLYTSGAPSPDRALVLTLLSDNENSCADGGPVFDPSEEWEYVVACYDGCIQPQATFDRTCLSALQFEVSVNITQVGPGGATITNTGDAADVAVTGTGAYTVGPFPTGTPVTLNVEGASVLCTWTSPAQDMDCTGTGIATSPAGQLAIHPNPSNGTFQLELPMRMSGAVDLQVMDLTGRVVAQQVLNGRTVILDLEALPNGLYTVVTTSAAAQYTAKISIQH